MKHTRIFLMAALVAVGLASCTKDESKVSFTATMEDYGTKTELSSNGHSLLWQDGDQIMVNGSIYQTDEGGHTSAEFSYVGSGSEPELSAPYIATYPTDYWNTAGTQLTLPATQNYVEDGMEKFPMCCKSYHTNLGFKNPCGVVRIHPTKSGKNITRIIIETERYITGEFGVAFNDDYTPKMTYAANGLKKVRLTCPQGRSISNGEDFYIYLPPATYGLFKITLYADDQTYCTKTDNTDIVVERSRVTDITLPAEGLEFVSSINALPGIFSVSPTKQVRFASGNLQNINGEWCFAEHQYDYLGAYDVTARDLFGWSTAATNFGMSTSIDNSDYSGDFVDWGTQIGYGDTWRTLSHDEWCYVLVTRPGAASKRGVATVTIDGNAIHGLILLPDAWTLPAGLSFTSGDGSWTLNQYTAAEWEQMEAAGAVFLPAAGLRYGTRLYDVGTYGDYWSSTPGNEYYAFLMVFGDDFVNDDGISSRYGGYSVRLVQDYQNN